MTTDLEALANKALAEEKEGNISFWGIPDDDPQVRYWKEIWTKGYKSALSEHSTKEPVAWLCEKEVLGKKVYELVMYRSQADTLMERGYTITPLVKKTV